MPTPRLDTLFTARRRPHLLRLAAWVLAAGLVLLAGGNAAHAQLFSPGKLHNVHADLEGDDKCTECHERGRRIDQSGCLGCHDDLAARIRQREGLHGRNYRDQRCAGCHVEHLGRKGRLIRWPGGKRENLNHAQTGWTLRGEHRQTGCDKCHDKRNKRGNRTFLGLDTACTSCHEDEHNGRFGKTCTKCHSETGWKQVDIDEFDHSLARFQLRGKHTSVDCQECHGKPAKYRGLAFQSCNDCHEDPHKGRFKQRCSDCHSERGWDKVEGLRENHPGVRLVNGHRQVACADCHDRGNDRVPSKGTECAGCHPPVHKARFGNDCADCHRSIKWLGLPERLGRRVHGRTRYPLRGEHREVSCQSCHPRRLPPPRRFRGIEFNRCAGCHEDKHEGRFQKRDGGECAQCHRVTGFRPTTFGVDEHASTQFALDGRHRAVPCSQCHTGERPRLDFRIAERACASCHENPHGTQFAAEMQLGGCAQCHSTTGWRNPKVDHSTWPLTGAHAMAACSSCHNVSDEDRAAGKAATYRGVPRECASCHRDEHAGQFRLSEPALPCSGCHETKSFRIQSFPHAERTGYELVGQHASTACESCHPQEQLANGSTVRRYRLGYRECRDCHANPHRE
ncbi:hypothetical protein [Haliangium ochraceum]|uniref:Uncharacterized protein n=1 Tax=Haliangium ochraceum (strain DSM 14365 / JCM 11303 / SMP-2) TaxID=502025 RepID=D0LK58_HALO1|nr:hypothetical protein [Haliangium ochraceum]ACY13092.1 conserved hypothetical protein [Haliangium ochraceum DSM 14365]